MRCRGGSWCRPPNACACFWAGGWASSPCGWSASTDLPRALHRNRAGVDAEGRKRLLGRRKGATETAAVATGLLKDLVTRGLPTNRPMLFLVDGASRRAIRDLHGPAGVAQRCQAPCADIGIECTRTGTCSAICSLGCTLLSARRSPMPETSTRRLGRRGRSRGWSGRWSATTWARRRPCGREWTKR